MVILVYRELKPNSVYSRQKSTAAWISLYQLHNDINNKQVNRIYVLLLWYAKFRKLVKGLFKKIVQHDFSVLYILIN